MIYIKETVFQQIVQTLGTNPPECGGVLGATEDNYITQYYFDDTGLCTPESYTPDFKKINLLLGEWNKDKIHMVGIIHSHGNAGFLPSCGDLFYCDKILHSNPSIQSFLLPIVTLSPFTIHMYRVGYIKENFSVQKELFEITP